MICHKSLDELHAGARRPSERPIAVGHQVDGNMESKHHVPVGVSLVCREEDQDTGAVAGLAGDHVGAALRNERSDLHRFFDPPARARDDDPAGRRFLSQEMKQFVGKTRAYRASDVDFRSGGDPSNGEIGHALTFDGFAILKARPRGGYQSDRQQADHPHHADDLEDGPPPEPMRCSLRGSAIAPPRDDRGQSQAQCGDNGKCKGSASPERRPPIIVVPKQGIGKRAQAASPQAVAQSSDGAGHNGGAQRNGHRLSCFDALRLPLRCSLRGSAIAPPRDDRDQAEAQRRHDSGGVGHTDPIRRCPIVIVAQQGVGKPAHTATGEGVA